MQYNKDVNLRKTQQTSKKVTKKFVKKKDTYEIITKAKNKFPT